MDDDSHLVQHSNFIRLEPHSNVVVVVRVTMILKVHTNKRHLTNQMLFTIPLRCNNWNIKAKPYFYIDKYEPDF